MELPYQQGHYVLTEEIAQGGMAVVYRAKYLGPEGFTKEVAVKRILPAWSDDPAFAAMLIDEAKILTRLTHPNIVQVYELGVDQGTYYFAMEYVPGLDLRSLMLKLRDHGAQLPPQFAYAIMLGVLQGLTFAHGQCDVDDTPLKIVHRDISPQNILVAFHGGVKIADFGIAKGGHRSQQTVGMQVKGKYAYMSPEQARGESIDRRSDIFSAGLVFYELLTGRCVFDGPNDLAILERVREARFARSWLEHVHPRVRPILRKALAIDPVDRFPTAASFLSELSAFVSEHRSAATTHELAQYLQQLFPTDVQRTQRVVKTPVPQHLAQQTAVLPQKVPVRQRKKRSLMRSVVLPVLCLGVALIQGDRAHSYHPPKLTARIVPALPQPAALPARVAIVPEVVPEAPPAEPAIAVSLPMSVPSEPGSLLVRARPWAYVSIPGIAQRRETPATFTLDPGEYAVTLQDGRGRTVSSRVEILSKQRSQCRGKFAGRAQISCD